MSGFRKGRSTTDTLHVVVQEAQKALRNREYTILCNLDIQGAYDNVNIRKLIEEMSELDIEICWIRAVYSLFRERTLVVNLDGVVDCSRTTWLGLPQGSPLSPLCFNVYITRVLQSAQFESTVVDFADDISLLDRQPEANDAVACVQAGIDIVADGLLNLGLTLSPAKCNAIAITNRGVSGINNLQINGFSIPYDNCIRLLGLNISSKLSWASHVRHVKRKVAPFINLLKSVCTQNWGAHPSALLTIYKSCIQPILEYGCMFFADAPRSVLQQLDRIQWKCLRICLGATKTCHTGSLEVLCGIMPLDIRRTVVTQNYVKRKLPYNYWCNQFAAEVLRNRNRETLIEQCIVKLSDYAPENQKLGKLPCFSFIREIRYFPIEIDFSVAVTLRRDPALLPSDVVEEIIVNKYSQYNIFATDGSKDVNGSGCAVVSHTRAVKIKLPAICSVFTAEMLALLEALEIISELEPSSYLILTDSRSSLECLNNLKIRSSLSRICFELRKLLLNLQRREYKIVFLWVPAHRNIELNEKADKFAKLAILDGFNTHHQFSYIDIPFPSKPRAVGIWQQQWNANRKGRYCYGIIPIVSCSPWFYQLDLNRREVVIVSKLMSNHFRIPAHLFRNNIINSPECDCGASVADPDHILFSCPRFDIERDTLISFITRRGIPCDVTAILKYKNIEMYKELCKFVILNNVDI